MDSGSDLMRNFKPPPFVPPQDAEAFKDIQYSSHGHVRQKLDLYLPKGGISGAGQLPLIVYIHGRPPH
jgi:acetyl esterase/lipase